jgi:hypothetical protein
MPSTATLILADVNASIGVIALMVAITVLVLLLVALSIVEAAGEHEANVESQRRQHRA